jgi:hypothetical protein
MTRADIFGAVPHRSAAGREQARRLAEAVTARPRETTEALACAECLAVRPLMVAMQPGPSGRPWRLCRRCWSSSEPATTTTRRPAPDHQVELGLDREVHR